MSAVTLETLRADYEAKRTKSASFMCSNEIRRLGARWYRIQREAAVAASLSKAVYQIARDYGLEAAMLYKLSDGAMDPRKAGEA